MTHSEPIEGVYLSSEVNLKERYGEAFLSSSHVLRLRDPVEISDPSNIRFALSWEPADDAFAAYPNIEMVSSIGAGVDGILKCRSLPSDTIVTRVRDPYQAYAMAGFVVWQVIWHHRKMRQYMLNQSLHIWKWIESSPVQDCTIGILGYGFMGRAVANALMPLGYQVIVACRTERAGCGCLNLTLESGPNSIRNTAAKANIIVNLLPLTTATRFILNAKLFGVVPQGSVLIQVGRGDHLVEEDLKAALDSGKLSAVSLDVFRDQPLPSKHPFWDDPRIMITPHIACESSIGTVVEQVTVCVEAIARSKIPIYAISRGREY
jgi:glyoxylate/hydroxypyruvate reductase A